VKLLGLVLAYAAAYVAGALVLLRLLIGEWPDLVRPGSRGDWFEADLRPDRPSLAQRVRAALARDVRAPRAVDMSPYERAMLGVAD
jgi:hypothetical protein